MAYESKPAFSMQNCVTIACGVPVLGLGTGNSIEIRALSDIANNVVDVDGNVYTNLIANSMAELTLRLQYGNPAQDLLVVNAQVTRTTGVLPPSAFTAISGTGTILNTITSANSNIKRFADDIFSQEASAMMRVWIIVLHNPLRI